MICKRLYLIPVLIILILTSSNSIIIAESTDGIHTLKFSTFGSIAAKTIGIEYQVNGALAQPVAGQDYISTDYALDTGFWQGYLLPVLAGDLNDDGQINLEDVIGGLHGLTGQGSTATMEADVDGDGKVNPAELIHIMRKQAHLVE